MYLKAVSEHQKISKNYIVRCKFTKPYAVLHVHFERLEITVIDTNDPCSTLYCTLYFFLVMCFYQRIHTKVFCHFSIFPKLFIIQKRTDQKYGCGSICGCLQNHIIIDYEVFSKDRNVYFRCNFPQILI